MRKIGVKEQVTKGDRFEAELKPKYKDERKFWDDYFKARDEYYNEE